MNLYIMRHGRAELHVKPDSLRTLVAEGELETQQVAAKLQASSIRIDTIVTSPYPRAQQTARIVKDTLGFQGKLVLSDCITPKGDVKKTTRMLDSLKDENILVVSHLPLVGHLLSYLTSANSAVPLTMNTAAVVHLHGEFVAAGCMQYKGDFLPVYVRESKGVIVP